MHIDLHCDTIYRMKECSYPQILWKNGFHVDIQKLKQVKSVLQCFALYADFGKTQQNEGAWNYIQSLYQIALKEFQDNGADLQWVRSLSELHKAQEAGKIGAMLTLEEGGVVEGDMGRLDRLYAMGIRIASLTWNYPNCMGYPATNPMYRKSGLTSFGKDAVVHMQDMGMIVDVSHLSDQGFWDVLELADKPIMATHSNARAITGHPRNLTDDMIRALGQAGGVMGLNFCAAFLHHTHPKMRIKDVIRHLDHIRSVGGEDVLAIGTDFDGIGCELEIAHAGQMDKLYDQLGKGGFTPRQVDKLLRDNVLRVFGDTFQR